MMAFNTLPGALSYVADSGQVAEATVINRFSVGVQVASTRVTFLDYEFKTPHLTPHGKSSRQSPLPAPAGPDLEHFVYPGLFSKEERGAWLATRMLERHQVDAHQASGTSDDRLLISGHRMTLQDHPRKSWNDHWLLIAIEHTGKQPQVLEEQASETAAQAKDDFRQGYRNSFTAMPWLGNYRPPLEHPKPMALVSQTATVCGPEGEEIYCDSYGRVQVRFRWDRSGSIDGHSSCWIRVASGWAGNGYGAIAIPRIGMEVVVTFEEGDPDRPLITGCLFNAINRPPYELPAHNTRSVFKSLSSPGGAGSNELHIEDRRGAEQIYVHAQRDMQSHVRNDNRIEVGNEQRTTIKGNSLTEVRGEESHTTVGPRKTQINADDYLNVLGSSNLQASQAIAVGAGQQVHIQAGAQVVIEAGASLTLKAGGQHLLVTSAGIFSSCPILPGGSPAPGVGMSLGAPQLPGETAAQAAGRMLSIAPAAGITLKGLIPESEPEPQAPLPEAAVCKECLQKAYEKFEPLITR
jgi:type VI secretion system secreted protein VgrG